ncbi:hypothetical protein N7519_003547 [Penicillium mononematosum]|uniref:uncharacterized protein n=1 Tax=Penicillium mononematosum TaxID=268346 RepID=UPI0025499C2A|nr:uncharacterized protein N7519_003547 [Penicillium mononematosum]KAJ6188639.1 hypothetical protein N7519_003547 [Penicillium mononematosum]
MPHVYHGQWSFDGDTFYVTSSSGHVHRRATYSELDDIFSTPLGDRRNRADYQDDWYEAQLLHFGLPPTKSKATAKMRLMDAFQDGTLDVPEEILEMEHKLTRAWMKQDLEARILGPSMQPPLNPEITGATTTDAIELGAAQRPSGHEEGRLFGASLVGGSEISGYSSISGEWTRTTGFGWGFAAGWISDGASVAPDYVQNGEMAFRV